MPRCRDSRQSTLLSPTPQRTIGLQRDSRLIVFSVIVTVWYIMIAPACSLLPKSRLRERKMYEFSP
jgi:hypothetical protein